MSWLRTDDSFTTHPKFAGWSVSEKWAWLEMMHYCARYRTDGWIPDDPKLWPKSVTKTLISKAKESGWIDLDNDGVMWIHDWQTYNPKDPTKAQRQAKWRAKRNADVDVPVDTFDPSTEPSTQTSTSRARIPSRPSSLSSTAAGSTPGNDDPGRIAAAELRELAEHLDDLDIGGELRQQAMAEPTRALACAKKATRSAKGNPAGYFRRLLESGDTPEARKAREYRPYDQPSNPMEAVRAMIQNGAIVDEVTLDAELRAQGLNGADEQALKAELATVTGQPLEPFPEDAGPPDHEETE